jgi:hypothetical protein
MHAARPGATTDSRTGQPLGLMGAETADLTQVTAFVAARYDANDNGMIDREEDERLANDLFGGLCC